MIVNKSMFPLQTGFGVISKMQDKFAQLQTQLGTGAKSDTLSGMGRDLPVSLSVRSRLATIEGYSSNIEAVDLRLSFYDNALTRFDKIEGEARNSVIAGQYGTNYINMATIPDLSMARLDEVVTLLRSDVNGRYLFGGNQTDKAPVLDTEVLLDGEGGRAGFKTVVGERKAADAGLNGLGRLNLGFGLLDPNTVRLREDGVHPFGFKLSTVSTTSSAITPLPTIVPGLAPHGDQLDITFPPDPAEQVRVGDGITIGLTLPDGTETSITLKAVAEADYQAGTDSFAIGLDAEATAANFKASLEAKLKTVTDTELSAASTYAAAENFFNGPGEPVLRVSGNPATATSLRVASPLDTVSWYSGQSPAIAAEGLGRLNLERSGASVSLTEVVPVSPRHGFQVTAASATSASPTGIAATYTAGDPARMSLAFDDVAAGDSVSLTLTQPDGSQRNVTLKAVTGRAGVGEFSLSAGGVAAETAANFSTALTGAITEIAAAAEGNPRQSVSAAVEDSGRVDYGMEANESGYLRLVRTLSSMAITTYPTPDADPSSAGNRRSQAIFDAMASRQQEQMSEAHNSERGSIEIVTMELGIARKALQNASDRHTDYKAQLDNLLSDVETVSKEDVAMEIMALQTRLTASYQATSMISKLSLVNFV